MHVTAAADGFVHPGIPSFFYGFAHKRNPRTFAGVDSYGRVVLVTSDGRDTDTFGLSIAGTAAVAQALGLEDALNLDGGGSSTMVVDGQVVNDPSDAAGERPGRVAHPAGAPAMSGSHKPSRQRHISRS